MKHTCTAVLLIVGAIWLSIVSWILLSNVILRETRLGLVAEFLDKLPSVISTPLFILCWAILLLGWTIPIALGVRRLLHEDNSACHLN